MTRLTSLSAVLALGVGLGLTAAQAETRLIMLGTGTPVPDATRAGSGLAVIHDGEAYLFDAGGGMVQRAIEAWQSMGVEELYPTNIGHVFLTHLHSDHTLDYGELAATYWWRRDDRLQAYGPTGLQAMTESYYAMQEADIALRTGGNQPVKDPSLYQVDVTEIADPGVVFDENGVTIEAFEVSHGDIHPAFGYKVTTPDKTIVISGDTTYNDTVVDMARGADILVHEVISEEGWSALPPEWQAYHHSSHTLTSELARLAKEAQPDLLVLTHILHYGAPIETALSEVQALYDGEVVLAEDLDEF
ncbi:MBL fold metallo-hydrolase [Limimaricola cinnabarinus]|uniref:MBL fold metallo-hydrolase n=1 Tax=Limimaricola cinnabarinus TaxID=1125964 RepID=UPI00249039A6|nr:MBL fold metallo-hydrolase [Limimaricola cinnabarinus]